MMLHVCISFLHVAKMEGKGGGGIGLTSCTPTKHFIANNDIIAPFTWDI